MSKALVRFYICIEESQILKEFLYRALKYAIEESTWEKLRRLFLATNALIPAEMRCAMYNEVEPRSVISSCICSLDLMADVGRSLSIFGSSL